MPPPCPVSKTAIEAAGALIRDGKLVAFPTETVYGVGGRANDGEAVHRLRELKGGDRPFTLQFLKDLLAPVEKREPCSGSPQVKSHGLAHVPQPDESNLTIA